jgi:hypothetical protein
MRKSNENSLKEVIDQLLDTYRLRDRINEVRVRNSWDSLMGSAISKRTNDIRLASGVLTIKISSAPLKEEMMFQREKILQEMNHLLQGDYIKEVKIL